jgi:4-hydroxyphenylacetate 3-monooxygenase
LPGFATAASDLLGTDFAGRHLQYERFYMGPAFVVRAHNHRECPWPEIDDDVGSLLDRIEPGPLLDRGLAGAPTEGSA